MAKTIRLANPLQMDSIVDGEGIRSVIWTQGCSHNCEGCHNPETHDFNNGFKMSIEILKREISNLKNQDGITFSGGDPMFQIDAVLELAKYCQSIGLNVWCYTGFTFEQLLLISKTNHNLQDLLKNIDVLIDGKFILKEKSMSVIFRGSKNQRILDVKKSLKLGKAYEIKKYQIKQTTYKKEYIFV
ncbi:MAG: anaerobic ribonucleoside-triphosphate reductase activating protein [Bacilli bacterium]